MLGFPLHRGQASGMQCGDVCSATDPQLYGWCGILVWLTCAGPAPMLGFPLHRGQASGMQCDILVWLTYAGPAYMRGFPLHRGQASGMQCGDVCSATDPQLKGWGGNANSFC